MGITREAADRTAHSVISCWLSAVRMYVLSLSVCDVVQGGPKNRIIFEC